MDCFNAGNMNSRGRKRAKHESVRNNMHTEQKRRRAEGTDQMRGPPEDTQATARAAKDTNAAPAKVPGRKAGKEMFQYACPFCAASVSSSVRTGQIDHRGACGHRFRVKDGDVAARKCDYVCPFCKGHVASNLKTGRIDHRTVCGNQFYVKEGTVIHKGAPRATVWSGQRCSLGAFRPRTTHLQENNARQKAGEFRRASTTRRNRKRPRRRPAFAGFGQATERPRQEGGAVGV